MTTPSHDPAPATTSLPDDASDPFGLSALVAAGHLDVVAGQPPVPVTVWRVAGIDHPPRHDPGATLTAHTAGLLVGRCAHPGDTIVSLGDDPALAGAAGAAGCRFLSVTEPFGLADLDHVAGAVSLLVLPWPPNGVAHEAPTGPDRLADLFGACRALMARDGLAVVALAPTATDTYLTYARQLFPAARRAGLGWDAHVVVVAAPITGERVNWRTTPADAATIRAAAHLRLQVELLAFLVGGRRD